MAVKAGCECMIKVILCRLNNIQTKVARNIISYDHEIRLLKTSMFCYFMDGPSILEYCFISNLNVQYRCLGICMHASAP